LAAPVLGPLTWPIVGLRFAASSGQTLLNTALGRAQPLERRTHTDWMLFGITFVLACVVSEIGKQTGDPRSPLLLGCVALPYSALQLRTCLRSYRAERELAVVERRLQPPLILPVERQRAA